MNDHEVGKYWDGNADVWTRFSRAGYDVYRDALNTPAFLEALPDIKGLRGLDAGCGDGHNTRLLARRGASMSAIDISPKFIRHATDEEQREPLGIRYGVASACSLPFEARSFDFVTSFMCMMDLPDQPKAFAEIKRVLKPGGFFQFSITHPCFDTPHRKNLRDENRKTYAIEVGGYFDNIDGRIDEWLHGHAPKELKATLPKFKIPRFHRSVSQWVNMLVSAGLSIEWMGEPTASDELVSRVPEMQDTQIVAYFLHVRCRA